MIKLNTLLCSMLLFAPNANAAVSFWYQDGNWTVWNEKSGCKAVNRPVIETNHTPYMSFWLAHDTSDQGISVRAYFWPGALAAGAEYDMVISGGGQDVAIPANAERDFALSGSKSLSRQQASFLAKQDLLIVQVDGTPARMAVDADGLSAVIRQLGACADLLKRGG